MGLQFEGDRMSRLENRPFKEEEDKREAGIMEGMSYDDDDERSLDMWSDSKAKGKPRSWLGFHSNLIMTTDREELYNTLCSIISNHSL